MVIGIDCSRSFGEGKTGTENYSYQLVTRIARLPATRKHKLVLFVRPNAAIPVFLRKMPHVRVVEIAMPYLWTQVGLAKATWTDLDVLWVPAHTLPILRRPDLKTVVTIHGLEYKWLPEYQNLWQKWYLPLSTRYAARQADKLIAVSESTKRDLLNEILIDPEKVSVILEGVEIQTHERTNIPTEELLGKWNLQEKQYILFVGTLQPRKNLPALIQAFSLVSENLPGYKLVLAGGKGWMTEEIFAAPGKYGIQDSVVFTGRVSESELSSLYQGAGVYVQPSVTEGFGLPVLEAMGRNVPVVVSDGGALPEVVGQAGLVVQLSSEQRTTNNEYGFEERLAGAIVQAATIPMLRAKLAGAGYKRMRELSWDKAASKTWEILASFEN